MNIPFENIKRALTGIMLLVAALSCQAGSIQVTPVKINLSATSKVQVLTVLNTGSDESVMQVTLNKWTLDVQHSAYVYKQSQELIVTPVTFRLAPGKQQIIRIGLRGNPPVDREASYRLLVEEVPPPPQLLDVTQTRLVIRHDIPVFVSPTKAVKLAVGFFVECASDGTRLHITNVGNVHALLRKVSLTDVNSKQVLGNWDTFDYLLPDAQKSWGLATVAPKAATQSFQVNAVTDQGLFMVDVKNICL